MLRPEKYTKIPVTIEAFEFNGTSENVSRLRKWVGQELDWELNGVDDGSESTLVIETLEGTIRASVGDFIIKGVAGEFYPCKPDIFHKTYT